MQAFPPPWGRGSRWLHCQAGAAATGRQMTVAAGGSDQRLHQRSGGEFVRGLDLLRRRRRHRYFRIGDDRKQVLIALQRYVSGDRLGIIPAGVLSEEAVKQAVERDDQHPSWRDRSSAAGGP